jgi:hypothetical protein
MSLRVSSLLFVALLALGLPPRAQACDSSSCVLVTRGAGGLKKGDFSVDLSFRYSDESKRLDGGTSTDNVVIPRIDFDGRRILPGFHREVSGEANSLQADVAYGITSRLSAVVSLPLFSRKAYDHTHVPAPPPPTTVPAEPAAPPDPNDPHGGGHGGPAAPIPQDRQYRTDGYGDTLIGVRYVLLGASAHRLNAGFSVKLPTGASEIPNTFDGGLHDPMLQPGTGSLDYVLSAQYVRTTGGPLSWSASASQQLTTGNDLDYRFGDETILGLGLTRSLRAVYSRAQVAASVQVKAHLRGRSSYLGADVPSTGSRMIILSPGLRITTTGGAGFYAYLQLPVYRHVNDVQLTTRSALLTGISKSF